MHYVRFLAIFGLILCGVSSRFLPHPPNFTAINSIAIFSAYSLGSLPLSISTVFITMLLSDSVIGFHSSMFFVYLSLSMVTLIGRWIHSRYALRGIMAFLPVSSLLFFIVTNFGVWLTNPMYSKTLSGLGVCYLAAIPFLANQFVGDLFYGVLIFGCLGLAERWIPKMRPSLNELTLVRSK